MKNLRYILGVLFILKCVSAYSAEITLGRVDIDSIAVVRNAFGRMMIDYDITEEDMHGKLVMVGIKTYNNLSFVHISIQPFISEDNNRYLLAYSSFMDTDVVLYSDNKEYLEQMHISPDTTEQKSFRVSEKRYHTDTPYWYYDFIDDLIMESYAENIPPEKVRIREDIDNYIAPKVYSLANVDVKPSYPGGDKALAEWIDEAPAKLEKMAGVKASWKRISIHVWVNKDGKAIIPDKDYEMISDKYPQFALHIKKLIDSMPRWEPGKNDNKLVNVCFVINFKFK